MKISPEKKNTENPLYGGKKVIELKMPVQDR